MIYYLSANIPEMIYFSTTLGPGDGSGISFTVDIDVLAINNQLAVLGVNITLEATVGGVILEHVDPIISNELNKSYM